MQHAVKEVMDMVIAKYDTNPYKREPLVILDYAQMTEIDNGAERIDVPGGRGNAVLTSFDHSKTTEINLTLPLVDMKLLSVISGDCLQDRITDIFKQEILTPVKGVGEEYTVELSNKPVETSVYANVLVGNRDLGDKFDVSIDGNTLTLNIPQTDGDSPQDMFEYNGEDIIVHYHTRTTKAVETLTINPTKFPQAISLYGDTLFRNQVSGLDEVYNIVAHKGRFRPEYTLSMSATDVVVLELTIDLYSYKSPDTREDIYLQYIRDEKPEVSNDPCFGLEQE